VKIQEFKTTNFRQMTETKSKLIHTFGALAELGQEVANRNDFHETMRTSLHLLLGSIAIMRGGVARYSRFEHSMQMVAVRGLGDDFPLSLSLTHEDERQFLANGLYPIEVSQAQVLPFVQVYDNSLSRTQIELIVPLVIRDEMVGALLLGEKATGEPYSSYDRDIISAMARHIGVAIAQRNMLADLERQADENRKLFDSLKTTYRDTVRAFAAAIDCKDRYTEGIRFASESIRRSSAKSSVGARTRSRVRRSPGIFTTSVSSPSSERLSTRHIASTRKSRPN
jgi:transcriptional regulator with GAF, ATPase, and Fis domain